MGYYTDYTLESSHANLIITEELKMSGYTEDFLGDGYVHDTKWYSHIEDMVELSKANPEIKIVTSGIGEEFDDIWEAEFLNGKHRIARAKIIEPCFDGVDWE